MRIAFLGTPAFAVPTLAALLEAGHDVAAIYTRAPKPGGRRGLDLVASPVQVFADAHDLALRAPTTLRGDEAAAAFAALAIEVAVVVGYGLILPRAILDAPQHGCLNLHPSLLPRWRGAAPIQRPIMAGDTETAAAIMRMEEGLDTGPVCLEERVPIPPNATAADMHDTLAARGARLMVEALRQVGEGTLTCHPQDEDGVLYAPKIDKAEARIDWRWSAKRVHDAIRALSPFPGAHFLVDLGNGPERVKVLRSSLADGQGEPGMLLDRALAVACGEGAVRLLELQRAGKTPMRADTFLRGNRMPTAMIL